MDREKKRTRWGKRQVKKCMDGAISVLLCLLLTPFLTIMLSLVEYARYQAVMEVADELMELADLFVLSDYDEYVHSRFGVLSVSQDGTWGDGVGDVLKENAKITGDQLVPSNVLVSGKFSLQDTNVLQRQLLDFNQLTAPTAILMEDLQLEQLLDKLNSLKSFESVTETVDQLATATEKLTTAVKELEALKTSLSALQSSINTAKNNATTLVGDLSALIKRLGDEGLTLPASASVEEIGTAIQAFINDGNGSGSLLDQIKNIYVDAKTLKDSLGNIKTAAADVKTHAGTVRTAIQEAGNAIDQIGSGGSAKDQKISESMTVTLDGVLGEMEKLVTDTFTEIKDETINAMETTVDEVIDRVLEDTGLADVLGRYSQIANGTYFRVNELDLTISDTAKQDIVDFLKMAHGVYNTARSGGSDVGGTIKNYFMGRFIPNFSFDASQIRGDIDAVVSKATSTLQNSVEGKVGDLLTKLSNLADKIFKLDLFANKRLNATVTFDNPGSSGAQDFIDAVNKLLGAVDDFKTSIDGFNFLGALTALWDLMVAIKDMFQAIFKQVGEMLQGIAGLFKGSGALYERIVISGYMTHSLPCRLSAGELMGDGNVKLEGEALTGFAYQDIPRGENTFKGAELEYVYKGTNDEIANQTLTFWDLYFLRLLLDLPTVFTDDEVSGLAAAATIAAWVVYIIYILVEPFLDTLLLVNGGDIPLIKKNCWITVAGMIDFAPRFVDIATQCEDVKTAADDLVNSFASEMGSGSGGGGSGGSSFEMGYQNYLLIMLAAFVGTDTQVQRLGDLIDLEATEYYQKNGKSFDMAKTYTAVDVSADMAFNPFVDLGRLSGNGPLSISRHMVRTVGY